MGCVNAHLEDWGEFGMGWQQLNTWVRMTSPDTAVFIAQAAPWSPATNGPITAPGNVGEIKEEKDLDKYKGKLGGKIVFLGAMPRREAGRQAALQDAKRRSRSEEAAGVSAETARATTG